MKVPTPKLINSTAHLWRLGSNAKYEISYQCSSELRSNQSEFKYFTLSRIMIPRIGWNTLIHNCQKFRKDIPSFCVTYSNARTKKSSEQGRSTSQKIIRRKAVITGFAEEASMKFCSNFVFCLTHLVAINRNWSEAFSLISGSWLSSTMSMMKVCHDLSLHKLSKLCG